MSQEDNKTPKIEEKDNSKKQSLIRKRDTLKRKQSSSRRQPSNDQLDIVPDDELIMECNTAQTFMSFNMIFLKLPISWESNFPCLLMPKKFNMNVRDMHDHDKKSINGILQRLSPSLKMKGNETYMNSKNIQFFDNSFPPKESQFKENCLWLVTVVIQGYKENSNGFLSPIWKILKAQLSIVL